jgi:hypothetical protein
MDNSCKIEANAMPSRSKQLKRYIRRVSIATFYLMCISSISANPIEKCKSARNELWCIVNEYNLETPRFFNGRYYDYLFSILHRDYESAFKCDSVETTAKYIYNVASFATRGAELDEYISESIETLCIEKPKCFNSAMKLLNNDIRAIIEKRFVEVPFHTNEEISRCYQKLNK